MAVWLRQLASLIVPPCCAQCSVSVGAFTATLVGVEGASTYSGKSGGHAFSPIGSAAYSCTFHTVQQTGSPNAVAIKALRVVHRRLTLSMLVYLSPRWTHFPSLDTL